MGIISNLFLMRIPNEREQPLIFIPPVVVLANQRSIRTPTQLMTFASPTAHLHWRRFAFLQAFSPAARIGCAFHHKNFHSYATLTIDSANFITFW